MEAYESRRRHLGKEGDLLNGHFKHYDVQLEINLSSRLS